MAANLPLTTPPASICILRLSAIGDVSHMLPVVRTLQKVWPETRITWIIGKVEAALLEGLPNVEFIVFDKRSGRKGIQELRQTLKGRHFDVFLNMQAALRSNLLSLLIKSPIKLGFDRKRGRDWQWLFTNAQVAEGKRIHVLDGFFQFLEALGISERHMVWDFPIPEDAHNYARNLLSDAPLLVINPSSSVRINNYRNWSAENYAAICDFVQQHWNMQIVLTGGPAENEKQLAKEIIQTSKATVIDLTGKTSLKQLLAVISHANVVIAPDTGPMHLAAAQGKPVIGLFATSNPNRSGPYLNREFIVNRYPDALTLDTGKSVAEIKWGQRVRDPEAMNLITQQDVKEKLIQAMSVENVCGNS